MPIKIKEFNFPKPVEKKFFEINRLRNDISHEKMNEEDINLLLKHTFSKVKGVYFWILVYLAKIQIHSVLKQLDKGDSQEYIQEIRDYLVMTYFKDFSNSDLERVLRIFNSDQIRT